MPSVLDRSALEQSPLADLHLLANELGVDGFRRLRKPDLVDAILNRQSGDEPAEAAVVEEAVEAVATPVAEDDGGPKRSRRGRRGGRGRRRDEDEGGDAGSDRDRDRDRDEPVAAAAPAEPRGGGGDERSVEGAVELLANGSGFLRLSPPDPTDDDVYISAAQVKRCELVSGDRVAGPVRPARRSERFPSLIRVDTINGRPAEEVAEGTRFEELPVAWPAERIAVSGDATVEAIVAAAPFGKGSRVVIAGPSRSGKSEALRRLAAALASVSGLEVSAVLIGVRPEEIADFPVAPGAALNFSAPVEAQAQAVEQAVEVGRRVAARGGDAVVLIDGFEYLPDVAARRALAAGRNLAGAGSLTVIATSPQPIGGETTVVVLDRALAAAGSFPALALGESGTLRPELLVDAPVVVEAPVAVVVVEAEPEPAPVVVVEAPAEAAPTAAKKPAGRARKRAAKPAAAAPKAVAKKPAAKTKPAAAAKKPAAAAKKPAAAAAKKPAAKKPAAKAKPAAAKPAAAKKPAAKAKAAATKKPAAAKRKPAARKRAAG
jgi:transcription termination factor Rho